MSVNEFYLILMESKVIEAQQPNYLVTLHFMEFFFLLGDFRYFFMDVCHFEISFG